MSALVSYLGASGGGIDYFGVKFDDSFSGLRVSLRILDQRGDEDSRAQLGRPYLSSSRCARGLLARDSMNDWEESLKWRTSLELSIEYRFSICLRNAFSGCRIYWFTRFCGAG